jgi:hypothetical protein
MGWLQIVLALLQLAPQIIQTVLGVEGLFGIGQGPAKKAAVMGTLAAAPPEVQSAASLFVDQVAVPAMKAGRLTPAR